MVNRTISMIYVLCIISAYINIVSNPKLLFLNVSCHCLLIDTHFIPATLRFANVIGYELLLCNSDCFVLPVRFSSKFDVLNSACQSLEAGGCR